MATALDRGPVSNPLIIAVLNQTVAGALQAFDVLSGEVFGSVHNTQSQEAQFARMRNARPHAPEFVCRHSR